MKKLLILFLTIGILISCNDNAPRGFNDRDSDGGWTNKLRNKYLNQCIDEAGDNEKLARKVCSCVLEKVEKKYTVEEAEELSEAVGAKLARECMDAEGDGGKENDDYGDRKKNDDDEGGDWTNRQRNQYIQECSTAAQQLQGFTAREADSYCECMTRKIEKKYSFKEASSLTTADLQTQEWVQAAADCKSDY